MADWLITIPKTVPWSEYKKELAAVANGRDQLNYRVRYRPKGMEYGDRMFVVHNGFVRGWMKIVGVDSRDGFTCATTGREWPAGCYIARSGKFHGIVPIEYPGFRGVRQFDAAHVGKLDGGRQGNLDFG